MNLIELHAAKPRRGHWPNLPRCNDPTELDNLLTVLDAECTSDKHAHWAFDTLQRGHALPRGAAFRCFTTEAEKSMQRNPDTVSHPSRHVAELVAYALLCEWIAVEEAGNITRLRHVHTPIRKAQA